MSAVANRYARALIDVLYPEAAETGLRDLRQFETLLVAQPEVRVALMNPAIPLERRKTLLENISRYLGFDRRVSNFLNVIVGRKRLGLFNLIIIAYQSLLDERLGVVRVEVAAAHPLDSGETEQIARKLGLVTGKRVELQVRVDPGLIGGVVACVGGTIYDGSMRQQLQMFKKRLIED